MSVEELDALAADHAAPEPEADPALTEGLPQVQDFLLPVLHVGTSLICKRANVSPLDSDELHALAESAATVLRFYNLGEDTLPPVYAAWLGLGMTGYYIAANRQPLPPREGPPPDVNEQPGTAAPAASDEGRAVSAGEEYGREGKQ